MTRAQHSETVQAPIAAVYQQWLDVESFASFMPAVRSAESTSEYYSRWTLSIGGITRTFDAEIIEQLPEERVRWRTLTGDVTVEGSVTFEARSDDRTSVTLAVDWQPATAAERAAAALGVDDRAVAAALRGFSRHVESTPAPKGHSYVTLRAVDAKNSAGSASSAPSGDPEQSAASPRRARHLKE